MNRGAFALPKGTTNSGPRFLYSLHYILTLLIVYIFHLSKAPRSAIDVEAGLLNLCTPTALY